MKKKQMSNLKHIRHKKRSILANDLLMLPWWRAQASNSKLLLAKAATLTYFSNKKLRCFNVLITYLYIA